MPTMPIDEADLSLLFGNLDPAAESNIRETLRIADKLVYECAAAFTDRGIYRWRTRGLRLYQAPDSGRITLDTYLENHASYLEQELTVEYQLGRSTADEAAARPDWSLNVSVYIDSVYGQDLAATLIECGYDDPQSAAAGLTDALRRLRDAIPGFPQSGERWRGVGTGSRECPVTL